MGVITKVYPESGYTVKYELDSSTQAIGWVVSNDDGDVLMIGNFNGKDFYQSKFTLVPSNVDENVYETLFYLYFENIKVECIEMIEGEDVDKLIDEYEE
jgi:hypothetical protein